MKFQSLMPLLGLLPLENSAWKIPNCELAARAGDLHRDLLQSGGGVVVSPR